MIHDSSYQKKLLFSYEEWWNSILIPYSEITTYGWSHAVGKLDSSLM